jgi:hypothetical protein
MAGKMWGVGDAGMDVEVAPEVAGGLGKVAEREAWNLGEH